jgi:hypothetical protein
MKFFYLFQWIIPLFIFSVNSSAIAGASPETLTADNTNTEVPSAPSSNITPTPSTTAQTSTQTGVIQFNNTGLSALTYPNCGGTCLFAIGRLVPSANGTTSAEAVAGVVWQLRSPENTQAESQRLLLKAQSENLTQESTLILTEKLADAIEQRKPDRITLLAILLAKRLGYASHHQLLKDLHNVNGPDK